MKTKEFIKRVEGLGYRVMKFPPLSVYEVFRRDWLSAAIPMDAEALTLTTTNDLAFAKLCIEYAETPIAEREEVKKYRVELPDSENLARERVYALAKTCEGNIVINRVTKNNFNNERCRLTEAEIKRNHEYLWQFAKEVE